MGYSEILSPACCCSVLSDSSCRPELRAFLGFVTYLSKFLPKMSAVAQPLYHLLTGSWHWTDDCQEATRQIRRVLSQQPVLALFDPALETRIEVDASGLGLGAVLVQKHHDTDRPCWRPVYFASRKLSPPETRYAAIEKEALAVTWGVNRFRSFVTGRPFVVITDHKPLLHVFKPTYSLTDANLRVQHLVLRTQDLDFTVSYRPGHQNYLADALSRLPVEQPDSSCCIVHHVSQGVGMSSSERQRLAQLTAQDETLCAVREALQNDRWPRLPILDPYARVKAELSVWTYPGTDDFLILRGERVVVPQPAVNRIINLAHEGHPGRDKTVQRLKEAVWWPGFRKDTQRALSMCQPCAIEGKVRPIPLQPRRLPESAWHTVAVDLFYFQTKPYFSMLDVYSRYPAVVPLTSKNTKAIIDACQQIFALFGNPRHIISDNGPQFMSNEFENQCLKWGVQHERIVPYQLRQNPVERLHQTFETADEEVRQASTTSPPVSIASHQVNCM